MASNDNGDDSMNVNDRSRDDFYNVSSRLPEWTNRSDKFWMSDKSIEANEEIKKSVKFCELFLSELEQIVPPFEKFEEATKLVNVDGRTQTEVCVKRIGKAELEKKQEEWSGHLMSNMEIVTKKVSEANEDYERQLAEIMNQHEATVTGASCEGLVGCSLGRKRLIETIQEKQDKQLEGLSKGPASKDGETKALMAERNQMKEDEKRRRLEAKEEIAIVPSLAKTAEELRIKLRQKERKPTRETLLRQELGKSLDHLNDETFDILQDKLLARYKDGENGANQDLIAEVLQSSGRQERIAATTQGGTTGTMLGSRAPSSSLQQQPLPSSSGLVQQPLQQPSSSSSSSPSIRSSIRYCPNLANLDSNANRPQLCRRTTVGFDLMSGAAASDKKGNLNSDDNSSVLGGCSDNDNVVPVVKDWMNRRLTVKEKLKEQQLVDGECIDEIYDASYQSNAISAHVDSAIKQMQTACPKLSVQFINQPLASLTGAQEMRNKTANDSRVINNRTSASQTLEGEEGVGAPPVNAIGEYLAASKSLYLVPNPEELQKGSTVTETLLPVIEQLVSYERLNQEEEVETTTEASQRNSTAAASGGRTDNRDNRTLRTATAARAIAPVVASDDELNPGHVDEVQEKKTETRNLKGGEVGDNKATKTVTKKKKKGPPHVIL